MKIAINIILWIILLVQVLLFITFISVGIADKDTGVTVTLSILSAILFFTILLTILGLKAIASGQNIGLRIRQRNEQEAKEAQLRKERESINICSYCYSAEFYKDDADVIRCKNCAGVHEPVKQQPQL